MKNVLFRPSFATAALLWAGVLLFPREVAAAPQASQIELSQCAVDGKIAAKEHDAIAQAAQKFATDLTGGNAAAAYAALTAEAKKKMAAQTFAAMDHERIQPAGPYANLRVTHVYLAKVASKDAGEGVSCGDTSKSDQWVRIVVKSVPRQAYALVEGQTGTESRALTLWLIPEQTHWHVQDFQISTTTLAGKSTSDLWAEARQQQKDQHNFNAFMLYATALQLTWRGPNLMLGTYPEIKQEMDQVPQPKDLKDQAGFNWESDNSAFKVVSMGPVAADGKIYLRISQELAPWGNDKDADEKNRALAAAFFKLYPECRSAFAGLAVEAHARGSSLEHRTLVGS